MMQAIAESGAAMSRRVRRAHEHLRPEAGRGVRHRRSRSARMLPPLIAGKDKACFAVTEPDAGLDTTQLKVRAERRGDQLRPLGPEDLDLDRAGREQGADPRAHHAARAGQAPHRRAEPVLHRPRPQPRRRRARSTRWAATRSTSNELFFDGCRCRPTTASARKGKGFRLHPARHESGAHPDRRRGGRHRPRGAAQARPRYARERVVFGRPIGQNQAIAASAGRNAGWTLEAAEPDGVQGGRALRRASWTAAPRPMPRNISRARRRSTPARPR